MTRRGLIRFSSSQPRPHFSRVPGRKFSHSTSDCAINWRNRSAPFGSRRFSVTLFLFRASDSQASVSRAAGVPNLRNGSPSPGCSTLITSAPNSPSMAAV